jgi:hypothetical protein
VIEIADCAKAKSKQEIHAFLALARSILALDVQDVENLVWEGGIGGESAASPEEALGEMLVWEPHLQKYMAFGNLKTHANTDAKEIGDFDPQ